MFFNKTKRMTALAGASLLAGLMMASTSASALVLDPIEESKGFKFKPEVVMDSGGKPNGYKDGIELEFAGFDASLGRLTGVMIWVTSSWDLGATLRGTGSAKPWANARGWVKNKIQAKLDGYGPGSTLAKTESQIDLACGWRYCVDKDSKWDNMNTMHSYSDNLHFFKDTFSVNLDRWLQADVGGRGEWAKNHNNSWKGNVKVQYKYAEVPEPSSLSLLGLGLSIIGFTAYRRRKSS